MMKHMPLRRVSVAAFFVAIAMLLLTVPAFAQGGPGGPGRGRGGGAGGSGKSVPMTPTTAAPAGSAATVGTTISRGFGSATLRISATGMPLPAGNCTPYFVHLVGTTNTDPPTSSTSIDILAPMMPAGTTPPTCTDGVWSISGTAEFGFNQDFNMGFSGTAAIETSAGIDLFTSGSLDLKVRVNPNKGTGD